MHVTNAENAQNGNAVQTANVNRVTLAERVTANHERKIWTELVPPAAARRVRAEQPA